MVCARVFSRLPVIRKTVRPRALASLNSASDDGIAWPISLVASAWDAGPNVKLSASIAVMFDSSVSSTSKTIARFFGPWPWCAARARRSLVRQPWPVARLIALSAIASIYATCFR